MTGGTHTLHPFVQRWWPELAAAALALALGLTTVPGDFVFDDVQLVRDNPDLDAPGKIPGLFLQHYWGSYASCGLYRPVTLTAFAIQRELFATASAAGYHCVSALLYAACAAVLVALARALGARARWAAAAGLLFAAHPIHVEVVAGIVGQAEMLATLAGLALVLHATRLPSRGQADAAHGTQGALETRSPAANLPGLGPAASSPGVGNIISSAALGGLLAFLALGSKETAVAFLPVWAIVLAWQWGAAPRASLAYGARSTGATTQGAGTGAATSAGRGMRGPRIGDSRIGDSRLGDSRLGDSNLGDSRLGGRTPRDAHVAAWRRQLPIVAAIAAVGIAVGVWFGLRAAALTLPPDAIGLLNNPLSERPTAARVAGALELTLRYARMLVWPWPLSADYSHAALVPDTRMSGMLPLIGLGLWLAAAAGTLRLLWRRHPAGLGLLLAGGALLPVSNLLFPIGTIFAERLLFVPSAGVLLALALVKRVTPERVRGTEVTGERAAPDPAAPGPAASGLAEVQASEHRSTDPIPGSPRWGTPRTLAASAAVAATTLVGGLAFVVYVHDWRDEHRLAAAMLKVVPASAKAMEKYAFSLYKRATAQDPLAAPGDQDATLAEVEDLLRRALRVAPDFPEAHLNLANLLDRTGRHDEALAEASTYARLAPGRLFAFSALARALHRVGRHEEALDMTARGLRVYPGNEQLHLLEAHANNALGRYAQAEQALASAVARMPFDMPVRLMHIKAIADQGDLARARAALDALLATPPSSPLYAHVAPEFPAIRHNLQILDRLEGQER